MKDTTFAQRAFWIGWTALLVAKVCLAASFPLFGDEAFYWQESRHWAWSYTDLPPLTALLIRFGTALLGDTTLGVRWPFLLLGALLPCLLVGFTRRLFGEREAWSAGLAALLLPLLATLGILALPDVPLTALALLALIALEAVLRTDRLRDWLWLGLWLALGWLTHYRFAILLLTGLALLLFTARGRLAARHPGIWCALGLGLLGLLPSLIFNAQHDWAALRFQAVDRHPWAFQAAAIWQPLEQALVVTPVLFLGLATAAILALRRARRSGAPYDLLACAAWAPWLAYFLIGLFADSERFRVHWPLPAYLPLLVLLPLVLSDLRERWPHGLGGYLRRALIALGTICAALGVAVILGYFALASAPERAAWLADYKPFPANFVGWPEVAARTREWLARAELRGADLVADNFLLAAELDFELSGAHPIYVLDHPLNDKHGRAAQLALWQRDQSAWAAASRARSTLLVVEDSAVDFADRLAWYHELCARLPGLRLRDELSLSGGRKRFLFYVWENSASALASLANAASTPARTGSVSTCDIPVLAYIGSPLPGAEVAATELRVDGWAIKDNARVTEVTILLDDVAVATANYGLSFQGVRDQWPFSSDAGHPDVGFAAQVDLSAMTPGVHRLALAVRASDGSRRVLAEQSLTVLARPSD